MELLELKIFEKERDGPVEITEIDEEDFKRRYRPFSMKVLIEHLKKLYPDYILYGPVPKRLIDNPPEIDYYPWKYVKPILESRGNKLAYLADVNDL